MAPTTTAARGAYHHGDVRTAAVEAGLEVLREDGARLSVREVARRVGVAHHALYHHFADKAALERALAARGFDALADRVADAADEGEFVAAYARFALAEHRWYALMMAQPYASIETDDELRAAASRVIAVALATFAPDAASPEAGRRLVTRAWMLTHGGLALHATGVLRLRDDEAFVAELLRIAGLAPDRPEAPQPLWGDHPEEHRP